MYYVSSRTENGLIGVTDTKDAVEEFYTLEQIRHIVTNLGIKIGGVKYNSQERLRVCIFDIRSYMDNKSSESFLAKLKMSFGADGRDIQSIMREDRGHVTFFVDEYVSFLYKKSHNIPTKEWMSVEWGIYFVKSLMRFIDYGFLHSIDDRSNYIIPSMGRLVIPAGVDSVSEYKTLISSFTGGQVISFPDKKLCFVYDFLRFNYLLKFDGEYRRNIASPNFRYKTELEFARQLVNNLRLSNKAPTLYVDNPEYNIWGRSYTLDKPLNCVDISYSFMSVDLRGRVVLGSDLEKVAYSFNSTSVEELVFKRATVSLFKSCFNDNYRLKKVVFEDGFILLDVLNDVFTNCSNAIFYVPESLYKCDAFKWLRLKQSLVVLT